MIIYNSTDKLHQFYQIILTCIVCSTCTGRPQRIAACLNECPCFRPVSETFAGFCALLPRLDLSYPTVYPARPSHSTAFANNHMYTTEVKYRGQIHVHRASLNPSAAEQTPRPTTIRRCVNAVTLAVEAWYPGPALCPSRLSWRREGSPLRFRLRLPVLSSQLFLSLVLAPLSPLCPRALSL